MTTQIKMKKRMKRKAELASKKFLNDLPLQYAIELEPIFTLDFINSLEDLKIFKEILTEKENTIEKQTKLTIEFINSLKDLRIIQKK